MARLADGGFVMVAQPLAAAAAQTAAINEDHFRRLRRCLAAKPVDHLGVMGVSQNIALRADVMCAHACAIGRLAVKISRPVKAPLFYSRLIVASVKTHLVVADVFESAEQTLALV